jgi:hypothetical protein
VLRCLCQALAEEPGIRTQEARQEPTGLPLQTLQWVGQSICNVPSGFTLHPEVDALLRSRRYFFLSNTMFRRTIPINHHAPQDHTHLAPWSITPHLATC